MIVHLEPRRVAVISKAHGQRIRFPIDLDTVLAVELLPAPAACAALVLRLSSGERVVAGTFSGMSEAGRDCGRLRVLAGLPAWVEVPARSVGTMPNWLLATIKRIVATIGRSTRPYWRPNATTRLSELQPW